MIRRVYFEYLLRPAKLLFLTWLICFAIVAAQEITENVAPDFGTMLSGASGRQFILNTDGSITGTDSGDYLFGAVAGDLTVHSNKKAKKGQPNMNIVAENITTAGGLTVGDVFCAYDGAAQTSCTGVGIDVLSGKNRTLLLGIDISTSQDHNGGDSASVSLDITVIIL
jgi:hypothetical protein